MVTEAETAEEAILMLSTQTFDIVVLDIMMPGMDGFELCRLIRENTNTSLLPIVIMTSLNRPEYIAKGVEVGATDYIVKPFSAVELKTRVNAALHRQHSASCKASRQQYVAVSLTTGQP